MLPTFTSEGDDTVQNGLGGSTPTPCPRCGSPRRLGRHGWTCARCALGTALDLASEGSDEAEVSPLKNVRSFDHYELALTPDGRPWKLGQGAMGITYKALDLNLHCPVALKVIHRRLLHESSVRERFIREARAAAGLKHPNVATVHHLGTQGEECFFTMEFIEGETLDAAVRRQGPLGAALALEIGTQVARALGAAERMGLVHRDIKPSNLMLVNDPGTGIGTGTWLVKVIDFGVARFTAAGGADLTGGLAIGTPSFASPEQLRGDPVDFRSDLYSLGVTLWWAILGRPPFTGDSFSVVGQHLSKPPPFGELNAANVPAPVVALLRTMLEKDPADRPPNAAALLEHLAVATAALPTSAASGALVPRGRRLPVRVPVTATRLRIRTRRRLRRWGPVVIGLTLAGTGVWMAARGDRSRPSPLPLAPPNLTAEQRAAEPDRGLAVLPFRRSTTGAEAESLLADGVAEEVTARLSRLDGLKVISQASTTRFRDSDLPLEDIANQLGVKVLLLGDLRQANDGQFTIHAELVDASDHGRVLWSQTYDHLRPDDLSLVQGRLSEDIAIRLRVALSPAKEAALTRPLTKNALAYDRYLRGRAFYRRYTPADLEQAAGFFRQALELDPNFAAAHAALAETYGQQLGQTGDAKLLEQAFTTAREGVRLEPNTPEVHRALGFLFYLQGRETECIQSCQRALALDPNHLPSLTMAGAAWRNLGRLDEALRCLRRAAARNPLDARGQVVLGETLDLLADPAGAEAAFRRALALQSDHGDAHCSLANLRLLEGDAAGAREELRLARAQLGDSLYGSYLGAMIELFDGQDAAAEAAYRRLLDSGTDRGLNFYEAISARSALGWLRARAGDPAEAARLLDEAALADEAAIRRSPDRSRVLLYDLAAVRAVQGHGEEAIIGLQRAEAAGWCHYRATRRDPRFASLAADDRFQGLLQGWQNRVEQMRRAGESTPKE